MSKTITFEVKIPLPENEYEAAEVTLASRKLHDSLQSAVTESFPSATLTRTITSERKAAPRKKQSLTEKYGETVAEVEPEAEPTTGVEPEAEPTTEVEPEAEPTTEVEPEAEPTTEVEPELEPVGAEGGTTKRHRK